MGVSGARFFDKNMLLLHLMNTGELSQDLSDFLVVLPRVPKARKRFYLSDFAINGESRCS
jgi:hypothetical protein